MSPRPVVSMRTILITILLSLMLCCACGGSRRFIQRDDLYTIEKLMPPAQVLSEVEQAPLAEHRFTIKRQDFLVYRFDVRVEPDDSDVAATMGSATQYSARMGTALSLPTGGKSDLAPYFFLFRGQKLCFHGLLGELLELRDQEMRSAGRLIAGWYEANPTD